MEFVDDFYERIMNTTDPLAMLRKAREIENQRKNNIKQEYSRNIQNADIDSGNEQKNGQRKSYFDDEEPFLRKVWEKIKNFFS